MPFKGFNKSIKGILKAHRNPGENESKEIRGTILKNLGKISGTEQSNSENDLCV